MKVQMIKRLKANEFSEKVNELVRMYEEEIDDLLQVHEKVKRLLCIIT